MQTKPDAHYRVSLLDTAPTQLDNYKHFSSRVLCLASTHTINEEQFLALAEQLQEQYKAFETFLESQLKDWNLDYAYEQHENSRTNADLDFLFQLALQNPELHHLISITRELS